MRGVHKPITLGVVRPLGLPGLGVGDKMEATGPSPSAPFLMYPLPSVFLSLGQCSFESRVLLVRNDKIGLKTITYN